MKASRFFIFLFVLFLIAVVVYLTTTPSSKNIQLTGIINGTDEVVSPLVQGRLEKLLVDEGSIVKTGQLIAEINPDELTAARDAAAANIRTLQARVEQSATARAMSEEQTSASLAQANADLTAARAQLDQAKATLTLNETTYKRDQALFQKGVIAAQEHDTSESNYVASQANVKALEDQVKAKEAEVAVAQANRMQVAVQQADVAAARAQLAQAQAQKSQAQTQLGYADVYAPIDGIIAVRVARQGEVVQPGAPIVTILDIDHLWVQANVEEGLVDSLSYGQKLPVRLPSGDTIEGTLYFKGVENDYATDRDVSRTKRDVKAFSIKVSIPNPGRRLFAGMTAYVELPSQEKPKGFLSRFGIGVLVPHFGIVSNLRPLPVRGRR